MKPLPRVLADGLDAAVQAHFVKLFSVLMTTPEDAAAYNRFNRGLNNLVTAYDVIAPMLETLERESEA